MPNSTTTAGVLLAAGAGTRYGMPKVLADDGRWLSACVPALAEGGCDDVVVVLGAAVVDVPAPAGARCGAVVGVGAGPRPLQRPARASGRHRAPALAGSS